MLAPAIVLPIAATSLALALLCALWMAKLRMAVSRARRMRLLRLAARLRAELLDDIDRLEARNRALKAHIGISTGGGSLVARRPVFGPDLIEELHAKAIGDLRARMDRTYRELRADAGGSLERHCRAFEEIGREAENLDAEIGNREAAWGARTGARQALRRPRPSLARAA